eukprot:2437482-Rhodomonas_salina.1
MAGNNGGADNNGGRPPTRSSSAASQRISQVAFFVCLFFVFVSRWCYARAMRTPVLTRAMLLPGKKGEEGPQSTQVLQYHATTPNVRLYLTNVLFSRYKGGGGGPLGCGPGPALLYRAETGQLRFLPTRVLRHVRYGRSVWSSTWHTHSVWHWLPMLLT